MEKVQNNKLDSILRAYVSAKKKNQHSQAAAHRERLHGFIESLQDGYPYVSGLSNERINRFQNELDKRADVIQQLATQLHEAELKLQVPQNFFASDASDEEKHAILNQALMWMTKKINGCHGA